MRFSLLFRWVVIYYFLIDFIKLLDISFWYIFTSILEIQEKIFYFENQTYEDKTSWGIDLKQVNYCCYFNNINGVRFITSNNVIEYYSNAFDEIGKIAYFDKKYNTKK